MSDVRITLPDSVINGRVTFYTDTPPETEQRVLAYNRRMGECRARKVRMKEAEFAYGILNPLVFVGMLAASAESMYEKPALLFGISVLWAVCFVVFAILRQKFFISTVATGLLCFLDLRFGILLAADIILSVIYERVNGYLKAQPGYPGFCELMIFYEQCPAPRI